MLLTKQKWSLQNLFDLRDVSWLAQASHPASRSCSVAVNSSHAGLPVPGLRSLRSCPAGAAAAAGWGAAEGAVTAATVDSGAEGDTPFAGGKKRNSVMISDGERACFLCVPVSLWGSGGWGCVRSTLPNRPQPFARSQYGRAYGKSCRRGHFWMFPASRSCVSRGRLGIQTCFVTCGKSFCVAGAILLRRFQKMRCS